MSASAPAPGEAMAPKPFDVQRLQLPAGLVALLALVVGFLASVGVFLLPPAPVDLVWLPHLLLGAVSFLSGWLLVLRLGQIEAERWRIVEDPHVTSGERDLAHKEAESERRGAGLVFFLCPTFLGYWLAYQFGGGSAGPVAANLLIVTPLVAFVIGLLLAQIRRRAAILSGRER